MTRGLLSYVETAPPAPLRRHVAAVWHIQGDRRLITCAALVATGKTEQMGFHFPRAIENGVTQEELVELITHLAFYVGWSSAMSAATRARELLAKQ